MSDVLQEVLGRYVQIWSQDGDHTRRDEGKLIAYDERWVKIETTAGETLFFPIANIRLLKPIR